MNTTMTPEHICRKTILSSYDSSVTIISDSRDSMFHRQSVPEIFASYHRDLSVLDEPQINLEYRQSINTVDTIRIPLVHTIPSMVSSNKSPVRRRYFLVMLSLLQQQMI